ncbi:MAG: glycoside hydrolase family 10 protein [Rhodoferax sp.]
MNSGRLRSLGAFRGFMIIAALLALLSCAMSPPATAPTSMSDDPPPAPREFRAAWVASVANIDWPSRSSLPVAQQQAEIVALLDQAQNLNLNAIVLQVRPSADALYPSSLEPWSEYLTGQQGEAPEPFYDPLKMWIDEAHRRGIELHAWLNPYRARHASARSALAATHIAATQPAVVRKYGSEMWLDPAEPAAVQRTLDVVADLVRRYDIDGIHIDDYFYPYPVQAPDGQEIDFPDDSAWQRHLLAQGRGSRADWRRQQVNHLIEKMVDVIHQEKSWVRFGISPFGLGQPARRPAGIKGFSQYDKIYADAELWLSKGWLDYLSPQLYWPIDQAAQAFPVLLDSWAQENSQQRHLWPGLFTSRIDASPKSWEPDEIVRQIKLTRARSGVGGHIHFSMIALLQNRRGIAGLLKSGVYAAPALVPATPWLGAEAPTAPELWLQHAADGSASDLLIIQSKDASKPSRFAIWKRYGSEWVFTVQPADKLEVTLEADSRLGKPSEVIVSTVNQIGIESARTRLRLQP